MEKTASKTHTVKYFEGVGRRKTAIARVKVQKGKESFAVNGKPVADFFTVPRLLKTALAPIENLKLEGNVSVTAKVAGGGIMAQAEAVRHGLALGLALMDEELRPRLRALGYMTRDSRMVERKKYGLKKARRAPQWAKR
ncbi:MAG TPA: 30S ribosomal protein S9 [Candidatus Paceibacterota bacterium]